MRSFRRRYAVLPITALALSLAACSASGTDEGSDTAPEGGSDELVIYSPQGEGPRGEYIEAAAEEELGIDVTFVSGGGGELTTRLLSEQNNAQADVVLGLGESQMYQLDNAGLFADYTPAWADLVPDEFQLDTDAFSLFSQTPIVMAYNAAALGDTEAPSAWEDLADPSMAGKFVLPPAQSQTGQAFVVGVLWRYADPETGDVSDEGWEVLQAIYDNAVQLGDGETFDFARTVAGEVPVVINWLGGVQTAASDNGIEMTVVDAEGGSPFVSTGIGIVEGSDSEETAQEFVDWFGSADFQIGFVEETNNDTPVNEDAVAGLPDAAAALEGITKQDIDWGVASTKSTEWLERLQLEIL